MSSCARRPSWLPSRWVVPATVTLLLLLTGAGCELEELMAGVGQDVKEAYDVDVNDPAQAMGIAAGAEVKGDKDKADGLYVLRGVRRAHHEQKGDALSIKKDDRGAIQEYEEALKWNNPPPPKDTKEGGLIGTLAGAVGSVAGRGDPAKTAHLEERIADSYTLLGDVKQAQVHRIRAARNYEEAAQAATDDRRRKDYWYGAAYAHYATGNGAEACKIAKEKLRVDLFCPP